MFAGTIRVETMQHLMSNEEIALRRKLLFRLAAAPERFGDSGRMRISELVDPALLNENRNGPSQIRVDGRLARADPDLA